MTDHSTHHKKFSSRVERFLRRHGMAPSTFGRLAQNNSKFIHNMRAGRISRPETMNQIERFMRDYEAEQKKAA
jgi:predicted transcriptional regulator